MAGFITRVELHNPGSDDYAVLHREMQLVGFVTRITGYDGTVFVLPTAMYYFDRGGGWTAPGVRDLARSAAKVTGKNSWILTADATGAAWYLNTPAP